MGIFDRLLKKRRNNIQTDPRQDDAAETGAVAEETIQFLEYSEWMTVLLEKPDYISRREFSDRLKAYSGVIQYFTVLEKSGMLSAYCVKNDLSQETIRQGLERYEKILQLVEEHNQLYIQNAMVTEKAYLDSILHEVDPAIQLDEDQRKVILTDEDYCLVVAGAGAGKTTTVAAKIKYLVEKKGVDPGQILVVSFTNKAVQELRDKINGALGIACPVSTFHSVGNAIIHKNSPDKKLNIVDESRLYFVIRDYFRNSVMKNESVVNKLILFFASYFDAPYEGENLNDFFNKIAKSNFATMRSELENFKREIIDTRTRKMVTIQNEILRSSQEVEIANFLYLNGLEYEYEPLYPYDIPGSRKPYTPDFIIRQGDRVAYIEHFGINEDGTNWLYSPDQLQAYKKAVNDKILFHRKHKTTLFYTFSSYRDNRSITAHLQEQLEAGNFSLHPRSNKEIMEKLVAGEENRYIRRLVSLICRFISNFKVNGYSSDTFYEMYHSTKNVRTQLFLDICQECYQEYERYLREKDAVDFQDMINESARILREVKEMKQKLDFRYVIVDEYQDISRQRFDLTKTLSEVTNAKIIAVGDDWQSIYAFSGSDITLFTRFEEKMGYAKLLKIVRTYRNSQEVIDIAGNFIQKNTAQIKKTLLSPKSIKDPVIIYTYDATYKNPNGNRRTGALYALAHAVETALKEIRTYCRQEGRKTGSILLLGRFGFDGDNLERSGLFEYISRGNKIKSVNYPEMDITFMTAHASKGLGYDNVIVVNGRNETYGFPSKVEDDPVLGFVIRGDRSIDYAEERRLFYVAMTRTKNRVYFVAPEQNPSEFLLEIRRDYRNVVLKGKWSGKQPENLSRKVCPVCGYPLQFRYKNAYGLRLYLCTNEPEVCGFMTNEYRAGKLCIMKCDRCRDGYLVVKPAKNGPYLLGCTNYKRNGSGCNNIISKRQFDEMMGYTERAVAEAGQREEKGERTKKDSEIPSVQPAKSEEFISGRNADEGKIVKPDLKPVLYKNIDLNDVLYLILQSLQHISEIRYFGITVMLDVLRGSDTKRLREAGLNAVPEYGALSGLSREELNVVIEWMLEQHFMLKTRGPYPVLHPTYKGNHYHQNITTAGLHSLKKRLTVAVPTFPYGEL